LSALVCLGRHTVTGLLATSGSQFRDWSAAYRLFARERFDMQKVFDQILTGVIDLLDQDAPLVVALDDTLLRKKGTRTHGVSWRRDPLGPAFRHNLIRGQRVLQLSAALPSPEGHARMVPVDLVHAPSPKKPRKSAHPEQWRVYRQACQQSNLGRVATGCLDRLRKRIDQNPKEKGRRVLIVGDGGFTNGTVMKDMPPNMTFIGRLRADAKLYQLPGQPAATSRGRRRIYGPPAPTPEQIRQSETIPWRYVRVHAAGKWHLFRIKTVSPLRWRATSNHHNLRLVVIAPLSYRPRKGSRLLYRKPAYLICTDTELPLDQLIQAYVWRWDIEVNFRDEKTLLGLGQAQVRNQHSVETLPQLIVAAYAAMLLAAARTYGIDGSPKELPPPKWRRNGAKQRTTTNDLINQMRAELWGRALGLGNLSDFVTTNHEQMKSQKNRPDLKSAVLYACN